METYFKVLEQSNGIKNGVIFLRRSEGKSIGKSKTYWTNSKLKRISALSPYETPIKITRKSYFFNHKFILAQL